MSPADAVVCLALVLAVVAVYWPAFFHPFVIYDDSGYVVRNPHVRGGLTRDGLAYALTGVTEANWHPLTMLSHMLDCQAFGLRTPGGHHAVSVALHALNAMLLFLALRKMSGDRWPSAAAAALFALHPLRVESVAWVAERKDVLAGLWWMLALLAYLHYVRRPSPGRYLPAALCMALGLMCKPMLVTLPLVLLLLDYWPLGRWARFPLSAASGGRGRFRAFGAGFLLVEKLPLLALSLASSIVTYLVQRHAGAMSMLDAPSTTLTARWANALVGCVDYLGMTAWPARLAVFYPFVANRPLWQPLAAAALLAAITAAAIWQARRRPWLFVGWFWHLVALAPVIGLIQVGAQSVADRYTYLPLIGVAVAVCWELDCLTAGRPWRAKLLVPLAAAVLLPAAVLSRIQLAHWSDSKTLFQHALAVTGDNLIALANLGEVFNGEGRFDDALDCFQRAMIVSPDDARLHNEIAMSLVAKGQIDEAVVHFREEARLKNDNDKPHYDLGVGLQFQGKIAEAIAEFRKAIAMNHDRFEPHNNLAWLLATYPDAKVRNGKEAEELALRACRLTGGQEATCLDTLAAAYAQQGRFSEAVAAARRAVDVARQGPDGHLAEQIEVHLAGYDKGRPWREIPRLPKAAGDAK